MAKKIVIYWRDIPSQIIVQKGRIRAKAVLSLRFQEAIDSAAMRAGKGSSNDYIAEWRRETSSFELSADPQNTAQEEAQRLEAEFPDEVLRALVRGKGTLA